jgi:hypothetical protein
MGMFKGEYNNQISADLIVDYAAEYCGVSI